MANNNRRPSRPSLVKMQNLKAKAQKPGTPKVIGNRRQARPKSDSEVATRPSLSKMQEVKNKALQSKNPKKKPFRSASGSAAKTTIAGRHNMGRMKTGWWRPVRSPGMSDSMWEAFKAMNRARNKMMSKAFGKNSLESKIYGKKGPGHAGYGDGYLQKWTDKALKQGIDPHFVDMTKWFAGAAAAFDFHNGKQTYEDLLRAAKKDSSHFMNTVMKRLREHIPAFKKLTKREMGQLLRQKYYTVQYGPDGRAK